MPKRKRKKRNPVLKNITEFLTRLFAVFVAYAFQAIAAGALIGVDVRQSILMAGIMGIATTFQYMARSYIDDGKMTAVELNDAFNRTAEKLDSRDY